MGSCTEHLAGGGSTLILELVAGDTLSVMTGGGGCYTLYAVPETTPYAYNQFSGQLVHEIL